MKVISRVCFTLLVFVSGTFAQIQNPLQYYLNQQMNSMQIFNNMASNARFNKMLNDKAKKKGTRQNGGTSGNNTPVIDKRKYLTYKESDANSLLKQVVKPSDPEYDETAKIFSAMISEYKETAAKDGFPSNDLAYALEYFVVNYYAVYHNVTDIPVEFDPDVRNAKDSFDRIYVLQVKKPKRLTLYREKLVYQQFQDYLAEKPGIQKMTDAEKQLFTETLAIILGIGFNKYVSAALKKDDQAINEARDFAKQYLERILGTTINKIHISDFGLAIY